MRAHLLFPLLVFAWPASAHSFYSPACCSEKDCRPLLASEVKRTATGWITPRGHVVGFDDRRVIPTPAPYVGMHICERLDGTVICLYVPEAQL